MNIVIIGNGISGVTAARHIRKLSDHSITIISSETTHFFSRTALMYIYMGHMRFKDTKPYEDGFWEKNNINLIRNRVTSIDYSEQVVQMHNARQSYDKLIIAVGSTSNKFGWPGQDLDGVHGLYHYQDLEAMERHSHGLEKAVIVGGGLIGIEMAEMFASRQISVTMLVRESSYWNNVLPPEEAQMVGNHIRDHHIDLKLNTELKEIHDDGAGKCNGITTNKDERIPCGFVGLTAGVHPNVSFLRNTKLNIEKGIVVDSNLQTNIPNVYAIGDCAQLSQPNQGRRAIEAIWYTGRMMGETVAYNICGTPVEYDPGIWFNSAKFFDIEYQVYGDIQSQLPEDQGSLYWQSETENKSIRINYNLHDKTVVGFNLMGVRMRHEVCEKWIKENTPLQKVVANLTLANFDPEWYAKHEENVIALYNTMHGDKIQLQSSGKWNEVFKFLKS